MGQGKTGKVKTPTRKYGGWGTPRSAAILAAQVLRLQCVESEEEDGEAGIHALESCEAWVGRGA